MDLPSRPLPKWFTANLLRSNRRYQCRTIHTKGPHVIDAKIEHLFSYHADLKFPPEVIGPVAEGIRVTYYILGGDVHGPRCQGKLLPVGGDWLLVRKDGICMIDVRATVEMHDGALVYMTYQGFLDPGPDGYDAFLNGTLPPKFPIRTAPRFQTAHPAYLWMNRVQAYGIGEVDLANSRVVYDVHAAL